MDEYDDRLLWLLDLICMFLGCPTSGTATATPEQIAEVTAFITMATAADIPSNATTPEIEAALGHLDEARWINGTHSVLPPALAQQLEAALASLEASLLEELAN